MHPAFWGAAVTGAAPQLDLFEHSRDTMLRNDALDALLRRDPAAAAHATRALADFDTQHGALPALQTLVTALLAATDTAAFTGHDDAAQARAPLQQRVVPAACAQFGAMVGAVWLAPLWRGLAQRAALLPFVPARPDDHAAPLWLRAAAAAAGVGAVPGAAQTTAQTTAHAAAHAAARGAANSADRAAADAAADAAARAAAQAVQRIESWRRIPTPLGWMAQAQHRSAGLDSTWPLLLELLWLAPPRFADTAQALADPLLNRLLGRFDDGFDPGPDDGIGALAWFPAWLLIDQPALLPLLRGAQTGQNSLPEQAFRLMAELLGLERQGRHHEVIDGRKRLRDLRPALYAVYMKARWAAQTNGCAPRPTPIQRKRHRHTKSVSLSALLWTSPAKTGVTICCGRL